MFSFEERLYEELTPGEQDSLFNDMVSTVNKAEDPENSRSTLTTSPKEIIEEINNPSLSFSNDLKRYDST